MECDDEQWGDIYSMYTWNSLEIVLQSLIICLSLVVMTVVIKSSCPDFNPASPASHAGRLNIVFGCLPNLTHVSSIGFSIKEMIK